MSLSAEDDAVLDLDCSAAAKIVDDNNDNDNDNDSFDDSTLSSLSSDDMMYDDSDSDQEEDSSSSSNDAFIKDIKARSSRPNQPPVTAEEARLRTFKELEMIATLVPARLLFSHLKGTRPSKHRTPRGAMREEFDGAVLFADISGFTKLAESLVARAVNASNAAENLVKYVGYNLNEMVEVICNAGGDCMKFAGDAILAVFSAEDFNGSLPEAAYACANAALQLQRLQLNAAHEARLSIHSGMGVGRVATYEVGGVLDRWEIFVAGSPVEQIGRCEPLAKSGELVVSFESRMCIERVCRIEGEMVDGGDFRLDKLLDRLSPPVPTLIVDDNKVSQHLERLAREEPDRAVELKRVLMKYVSRPVIFSIESHAQSLWGAELRDCSTLFCKFRGLNFSDTHNEDDLATVQYVVKNVVQKVMQQLEGTVCRFMVDDKGASMLLAFGLVPYAHVNDCVRAVKAALLIRDGVAALSLLSSTAKTATVVDDNGSLSSTKTAVVDDNNGSSSVVVTSFLGPDNVLPRIKKPISCQIGITHGRVCVGMVGGTTRCEYTLHGVLVNRAARLMSLATDGAVLCDPDAHHQACKEVEFDSEPTLHKLKGERKEILVYKALRKASGLTASTTKQAAAAVAVQDDGGLVGRDQAKLQCDEFLRQLQADAPVSLTVGITGETGIGKSLLLQYVGKRAVHASMVVLTGFALDTESATPFFAWKNLVIQLVSAVASSSFADMSPEERRDCLVQALPLDKREYYPLLAPFVDEVVPVLLLEDNEVTLSVVRAQRSQVAMEVVVSMLKNFANSLGTASRLVLLLDDAQWMDELSLDLLRLVQSSLTRVGIAVGFAERFSSVQCAQLWQLHRLSSQELAQCMQLWLKCTRVADSCVHFMMERTGGNPLFSEELCHLMLVRKHFELVKEGGGALVCGLRSFPDSDQLSLTSSIQSIMTATLDRLSAAQQIVLRVVALMGAQCTLQDLGGVFREINERTSTNKDDASDDEDDGNGEDYEEAEDSGYFSLADVLKQGFDDAPSTPTTPTTPKESQRQRLAALFTSIDVDHTVNSLVGEQGILEPKPHPGGNAQRTVYVFRHLLMKSTCLAGLRDEVRRMLHRTIAMYYEERSAAGGGLQMPPLVYHTLLADHFFKANKRIKALKYLQLAGALACDLHANQQIHSIYSRLIELLNTGSFQDEIAVSDLIVAQWHRKVAESLFRLNETYSERLRDVERHLFKALQCLGLDTRAVQGQSGKKAGLLPVSACASGSVQKEEEQPTPVLVSGGGCMSAPVPVVAAAAPVVEVEDGEDEDGVRVLPCRASSAAAPLLQRRGSAGLFSSGGSSSRRASLLAPSAASSSPLASRLRRRGTSIPSTATPGEMVACDYVDWAEDVEPFLDPDEFTLSTSQSGESVRRLVPVGGGASVPPLRPRLVLSLSTFRRLRKDAMAAASSSSSSDQEGGEAGVVERARRSDAVESLLEACAVYDMLGTMQRDRTGSVVALERRLNCILLAEAAWAAFPPKQQQRRSGTQPPSLGGTTTTSFKRHSLGRASSAPVRRQPTATAKNKSSQQQHAEDELSRSYARAAVFFAGMPPHTQWRRLSAVYASKANEFLRQNRSAPATATTPSSSSSTSTRLLVDFDTLSSTSEYSENFVSLHRRCGKWDVLQGRFVDAKDKLRYAVWGAKFMHLESMFDAKAIELACFFFNGDLDGCNRNATDLFEKNTPARFVAMGARFMALCGAYDVARHKLASLLVMSTASSSDAAVTTSSSTSSTSSSLAQLEQALMKASSSSTGGGGGGSADALLTLSLVAWRVDRNAGLAVRAAVGAAECALRRQLAQVPIGAFHELALCFTALWDPIRDGGGGAVGGSDVLLQAVDSVLDRLVQAVRRFALVYRVCRPHAKYCIALRNKMRRVMHGGGGEPAAAAAVTPTPAPVTTTATPSFSTTSTSRRFSLCTPTPTSSPRPSSLAGTPLQPPQPLPASASVVVVDEDAKEFLECAQFARQHECFWVQGLALLEGEYAAAGGASTTRLEEARDVFAAYEHAGYELARCDKRLREAQRLLLLQQQQQPTTPSHHGGAAGAGGAGGAVGAAASLAGAAAASPTSTLVQRTSSSHHPFYNNAAESAGRLDEDEEEDEDEDVDEDDEKAQEARV